VPAPSPKITISSIPQGTPDAYINSVTYLSFLLVACLLFPDSRNLAGLLLSYSEQTNNK